MLLIVFTLGVLALMAVSDIRAERRRHESDVRMLEMVIASNKRCIDARAIIAALVGVIKTTPAGARVRLPSDLDATIRTCFGEVAPPPVDPHLEAKLAVADIIGSLDGKDCADLQAAWESRVSLAIDHVTAEIEEKLVKLREETEWLREQAICRAG